MPSSPFRRAWLLSTLACIACLLFPSAQPLARSDVRALWVVRTSLTSPASVATMVSAARDGGFNTLLVQVRGRADAYYLGGLEPRPAALANQASFDPLAETIARAHDAGLSVHAWINVNLVAAANELPTARDHVVYRHPEWLMVPKALAEDLAKVDPHSPEYLGRLARYVRARPGDVEGLYLSPTAAGAADYTVSVVRDIVERYAVDGVHFDYARYPNDDFDYSRETLAAFRRDAQPDMPAADRQRYDARLSGEPLLYTRAYPERWRRFRTRALTMLVGRLHDAVKAVRPKALVSAAVGPDGADATARRMQDWPSWLATDLIDVVCPMAYTTDAGVFETQIAAVRAVAGHHAVWAGIGAYRLDATQIAGYVSTARRQGVDGVILFSYDSLTAPSRGPDYLMQVGRSLGSEK